MDYRKLIHTLPPSFTTAALLAMSAIAVSGCGSATDSVVTSCNLPSDQTGTISGKWAVKPVPVAFHAGDWASSEMSSITTAADTWNQFYGTSQNFQIIDYGGSSSSPRTSTLSLPADPCSNQMLSGTKFSTPIVIYKDTTWTYGSQLIALTRFCTPTGSTGIPNMYSAVIEVNYANYFTNGQMNPDLQSILLHELGHLAGLNHSCENFAKSGTPLCNSNSDYASAVMAPVFTFNQSGQGEQKRTLTDNDEGRANCLYDGQLQTN